MNNKGTWGAWTIRAVFLALAVAALALTSAAQDASPSTKKATQSPAAAQAAPAPTSDTSMGQKIFIDPVTRKPIQPSADDMKALENAGKKTTQVQAQPRPFIGRYGGVGVRLNDSFMMNAVAAKGADGKLSTSCIEDEAKAAQAAQSGNLATPQTTKKEALDEK